MTSWPAKNGIPLPQRHFQQMLVCCVVAAICTLFAAPAWASGCHDLRVGATVHGLDPFGNPLPENIVKTYSGGEFAYYLLPNGKTCNGPSCRSLPPVNMTSQPAIASSDRVDITFLSQQVLAVRTSCVQQFWFSPAVCLSSPVLDGLFRPPTV